MTVIGSKGKKKDKKKEKKKQEEVVVEVKDPEEVKLSLEMMRDFANLKIKVPYKVGDLKDTIATLQAKITHFEEEGQKELASVPENPEEDGHGKGHSHKGDHHHKGDHQKAKHHGGHKKQVFNEEEFPEFGQGR